MPSLVARQVYSDTYSLNTAVGTTPEIDFTIMNTGAFIHIPNGSSITSLTYHVCDQSGGTYLPAQDSGGSAITQTVAATKAYAMPSAVLASPYIKIVVNAAGSVVISYRGRY